MIYREYPEGLEIPTDNDPDFVAYYCIVIHDKVWAEWAYLTELDDLEELNKHAEFDDSRVFWKIQKPQIKQWVLDWMNKNFAINSDSEVVIHTPLSNEVILYFKNKSNATTFIMNFATKLEYENGSQ